MSDISTEKLSNKEVEKILSLSNDPNLSRRDIAERIHCSKMTVYRYQKIAGIL